MKQFISSLLTLFFISNLIAQTLNQEVQPDGKKPFLLGKIDKNGLTSENYNGWFSKNYTNYEVNKTVVQQFANQLKDYKILAFMGTWCGDSKRQVPKLYKVLEAANFPMDQLDIVAVSYQSDLYKQSPNHEEKGLNIHRVPTFIFYKNGKEINRIVEEPIVSFELDILNILAKNTYQSNYYFVDVVHKILDTEGIIGLSKKAPKIVVKYKDNVRSMYELNTYSKVLISTNRNDEALEVLKLNTQLFPDNPRVFERLIKVLVDTKHQSKASKLLAEASKKFPEDKRLKSLSLDKSL